MIWKIVGIGAASLTMFGFLPQVIKMSRVKSSKDISLATLLQFTLGVLLWIVYGFYLKDLIIIIANIVTLVIFIIAIILYLKYK